MTVPFPQPFSRLRAKELKRVVLRRALIQMGRISPGNKEPSHRLFPYLYERDNVAANIYQNVLSAIDASVAVKAKGEEPKFRQRARDWLDALDAYLDRKYPCQAQTEPSAPAGAKGTSGAPTPPPAADAAASASGSAGSTGSGPGKRYGKELVRADREWFKEAREAANRVRIATMGTGIGSTLLTFLDRLEAHQKALADAGLLKP